MANLNSVSLMGRLTKDVELNDSGVANFSIAINEKWKDKNGNPQEKTEFINLVAFGKLAETCANYLEKGRLAYFEGKIETTKHEDKYYTKVKINKMQFVGDKPQQDAF